MELNQDQIRERIPHRYPFLFLDAVTDFKEGESIEGYKNVTANEPFFQGHFPDKPIMPGVIIAEALAQLGCVFMVEQLGDKAEGKQPLFLGIDRVKFRSMVQPGMRLDMKLSVQKLRGTMAVVKGEASVDGETAMTGELTLMLK